MKKLLVLALLALGLGGGVWKAQNPEGTLEDLKTESISTLSRVKSGIETGVDTIVNYKTDGSSDSDSSNETGSATGALDDATTADVTALVDEKLAENTSSLTSSLVSLQGALDERGASVDAITTTVAKLDDAQQETLARADAVNERQKTIESRLDALVSQIDEQTTGDKLDELNAALQTQQEQITSLQTDLVEHQSSLDTSVADMKNQTRDLDLRLGTLLVSAGATAGAAAGDGNSDPDTLAALSVSIDGRLKSMEDRLAAVNAESQRIDELNEQLANAREKITELEQNQTQTTEAITELDSSVQALSTDGESLSIDAIQAQIRDELAAAQSQIDNSSNNNTTQLETLLETTRNRIQTLEQRVQDLPSSEADDALQNQSALQAQIADLEQRLEGLSKTDPALENTVNDVKEQVEQLSSQEFVTREDLLASEQSESIEYKIYFERNSTDISEDAATVLNSFIAQEKNRTTGVSIFGFTDRAGAAAYNQQLALQRATKVRSYLIQNGLDFIKIKALSGLGEDAAATVLPDDSADALQRVVVIYADQP